MRIKETSECTVLLPTPGSEGKFEWGTAPYSSHHDVADAITAAANLLLEGRDKRVLVQVTILLERER